MQINPACAHMNLNWFATELMSHRLTQTARRKRREKVKRKIKWLRVIENCRVWREKAVEKRQWKYKKAKLFWREQWGNWCQFFYWKMQYAPRSSAIQIRFYSSEMKLYFFFSFFKIKEEIEWQRFDYSFYICLQHFLDSVFSIFLNNLHPGNKPMQDENRFKKFNQCFFIFSFHCERRSVYFYLCNIISGSTETE